MPSRTVAESQGIDSVEIVEFLGRDITIYSAAEGELIDVAPCLRDPEGFRGDPHVDHVIDFGSTLAGTRVEAYADPDGFFSDPASLPERGVAAMVHHPDSSVRRRASETLRRVNLLAMAAIGEPSLYEDIRHCRDYYDQARHGYNLLAEHGDLLLGQFTSDAVPVMIMRAGEVATKLQLGLKPNDDVPRELQVITKRAHPAGRDASDMIVTVKWQHSVDELRGLMKGNRIKFADTVLASGASESALLLAAEQRGHPPSAVIHENLLATQQGVMVARTLLNRMGIESAFKTVGLSNTLNELYYCVNPAVGDAGDFLSHFRKGSPHSALAASG